MPAVWISPLLLLLAQILRAGFLQLEAFSCPCSWEDLRGVTAAHMLAEEFPTGEGQGAGGTGMALWLWSRWKRKFGSGQVLRRLLRPYALCAAETGPTGHSQCADEARSVSHKVLLYSLFSRSIFYAVHLQKSRKPYQGSFLQTAQTRDFEEASEAVSILI